MKRRLAVTLVAALVSHSCTRARFYEFRGEKLETGSARLSHGRHLAEQHCSTCHLTPQPESMSQPTANFMLAYMGLFLGIDASRSLDQPERAQFRQRFELLKNSAAIPAKPAMTAEDWAALRSYYLAEARYAFESSEKAHDLPVQAVPFSDQGVTLLRELSDGRIAAGGGVNGEIHFLRADLTEQRSIRLDSPPVHIVERDGGYYVLTLGSLLGALGDENKSALYFIGREKRHARLIAKDLPRAGHFLATDTNHDGQTDFFIAGFGNISGGGLVLVESRAGGYTKRPLSRRASLVRLALIDEGKNGLSFFALCGGAAEALVYFEYAGGLLSERELLRYPPHLGSVWLEYADVDGDGTRELLVLSGDNADAGPYNEVKPDQGLRIYSFERGELRQQRFLSLPGALSLTLVPRAGKAHAIAVSRFYSSPREKQDLSVMTPKGGGGYHTEHYTLPSRPTVLTALARSGHARLLVGSGNFPLAALDGAQPVIRRFSGPALMVTEPKFASP